MRPRSWTDLNANEPPLRYPRIRRSCPSRARSEGDRGSIAVTRSQGLTAATSTRADRTGEPQGVTRPRQDFRLGRFTECGACLKGTVSPPSFPLGLGGFFCMPGVDYGAASAAFSAASWAVSSAPGALVVRGCEPIGSRSPLVQQFCLFRSNSVCSRRAVRKTPRRPEPKLQGRDSIQLLAGGGAPDL